MFLEAHCLCSAPSSSFTTAWKSDGRTLQQSYLAIPWLAHEEWRNTQTKVNEIVARIQGLYSASQLD